jgi:WD40 repeat protein
VVLALTNGTLGLWSWTNLSAAQPLPSSFRNLSVPFANSDSWEWILQPHGNRLAIGRFDQQTVYDFDLDSVELKASWKAPGTLSALAFTPDDRFCVMSAYRGQLLAHDLVSGRQTEISDFVPNILGVQTAPGGRQLAVCSEHGSVHLWESPSWRSVGVLGGFLHAVTSLAFSPDGQRLAAGSDGAELLRVFDLQSRLPLITLPGDRPLVQIAFDPTGNDLAGLDVQGQLHLWRAPSPSAIDAAAPAPPH